MFEAALHTLVAAGQAMKLFLMLQLHLCFCQQQQRLSLRGSPETSSIQSL